MADRGVAHLLVLAPGGRRPVGVLSSRDVAGILAWGGVERGQLRP